MRAVLPKSCDWWVVCSPIKKAPAVCATGAERFFEKSLLFYHLHIQEPSSNCLCEYYFMSSDFFLLSLNRSDQ